MLYPFIEDIQENFSKRLLFPAHLLCQGPELHGEISHTPSVLLQRGHTMGSSLQAGALIKITPKLGQKIWIGNIRIGAQDSLSPLQNPTCK